MDDDRPPDRPSGWVAAGKMTAVAFEFTGTIVAGVFFGWLGDRYLDTEPWLLILGTLLGTCAGFYQMIRSLRVLKLKR